MPCRLSCSIAVVLSLLAVSTVFAQADATEDLGAPAHIAVVQGSAVLERNGVGEPAAENVPLLQGDRLKTESGRLEILPPRWQRPRSRSADDGGPAGGRVDPADGRPGGVPALGCDGRRRTPRLPDRRPRGSVRFTHAGEYRIFTSVSNGVPFLDVSVVRGRAVIDAEGRKVPLSAGERAQAIQGEGVTAIGPFNSALADAFLEWSEMLRGQRVGTQSTAYLPPELQVYGGTFDRDGSWENSSEYGPVWYPRVESEWRPYYDGGWYPCRWGWTWVGAGRWTWPTHHYGRWGHGRSRLVLDPVGRLGTGVGLLGIRDGLTSPGARSAGTAPRCSASRSAGRSGTRPWLGWTAVPHHAFGRGTATASSRTRFTVNNCARWNARGST